MQGDERHRWRHDPLLGPPRLLEFTTRVDPMFGIGSATVSPRWPKGIVIPMLVSRLLLCAGLLTSITLTGCLDHPLKEVQYDSFSEAPTTVPVDPRRKVDILFVIDNSGSMGEEQAALARNFEAFVGALEDEDVDADYRIGITTTDDGNPWCTGTGPESGALQLRSCRDHLDDFVFSPGTSAEVDRRTEACEARCPEELAGLTTLPTAIEQGGTTESRPWLERGNGTSNVPDGITTAQALACWGPQGINGCGYESPLESMRKALIRSDRTEEAGFGFMRPDALLQVVFITDEADCSMGPGGAAAFDPNGSRALWPDPDVACSTGEDGHRHCEPTDIDAEGNPAAGGDEVLHPLGRYVEVLDEIDRFKRGVLAQDTPLVLVSVIAGVPADYAGQDIDYGPGTDAEFEADYGVGAGCSSGNGEAVPPVRLRALADAFADEPGTNLYSVCDEDYSPALEAIAQILLERLRPSCVDACVANVDSMVDGDLQSCTVVHERDGQSSSVPTCLRSADGSWERPEGADLCVYAVTDEDMHLSCQQPGQNIELRFVRAPGVAYGDVTATCEISGTTQLDCP